jgi:predicted nucleic acid-binding protein
VTTDLVFVDTNVFVYRLDAADAQKQARARAWLEQLWSERSGRVSYQVLVELYTTLTRKLAKPLAVAEAREAVQALSAWSPVVVDDKVLDGAWAIEARYGLSWWDALVVAAARVAGCRFLLTEDLQHGQELAGVEVVDPFLTEPSA